MTASPATDGERPRLVFLTQWFEPEATLKGLRLAKRLTERGFDVEVVTGFPNYPGGKVYEGYRLRPVQREVMEGVAVTRLYLHPSHDRSRIGRVLNYVSFFLSATIYLTFFARRADVIYAYHPPLTVGMAAAVTRIFRRTPVVLDVQDMWPDTLRATGMMNSEGLLDVVGRFCRWTWCNVDHISVLSPGFRTLLLERGVPAERISVIPNWADEAAVADSSGPAPAALADPGRFRLLFAGNMGAAQALDAVLDAAALLAEERTDAEICLLGAGIETDRLKARVEAEALTNVRFLPRVPMTEVGAYLAAADALLVHLKADPLFAITIPSKTQAYMAAGKPIIMAVQGDAAELVRQSSGGVVVPPEDPRALADAVKALAALPPEDLSDMGANARRFYDDHLSFDQGSEALGDLLQTLRQARSRLAPRSDRLPLRPAPLKRLIDIVLSAGPLIALSPLLLGLWVLVRARMGSPALFRQMRPGLHGRPFEMIKFRTMRDALGPDGRPLSDAERLTPFGKWLRATSLDELPELWNVLKGDMSLVGPRPLALAYLPLFSAEQRRRHDVRPGITGWAQVNGRNSISWAQKFDHDVWYVDNHRPGLDLRIMSMTVLKVVRGADARAGGQDEVESFDGSN